MWVKQQKSSQTCRHKHTLLIASHPCELSEWVCGCVWGFSFFFLFSKMFSRIRKCDAVTEREEAGTHCLPLCLVTWEAPRWRPLCCSCCCWWPVWVGQVRLGAQISDWKEDKTAFITSPPCFLYSSLVCFSVSVAVITSWLNVKGVHYWFMWSFKKLLLLV